MEKHPILLDTNAYLRIAKRVRPLLGVPFGRKNYELLILAEVEKEVKANRRLRRTYPWFDDDEHKDERLARALRLAKEQRQSIAQTAQFLLDQVAEDARRFIADGGSPPGETDCYVLAVAIELSCSLASDDEPLCRLAADHGIEAIRCYEVVHRLHAAKKLTSLEVVELYEALERNGDLTRRWIEARGGLLKKIFDRCGRKERSDPP